MKRSRFTEEQVIGMLRELEAEMKTTDVCRKQGISQATFYKYKAKFGGMDLSDARKLKVLEDENAKLTTLLAETMLGSARLKDVASKKWCRPTRSGRQRPPLCRAYGVSRRRAHAVLQADLASVRHRSTQPDDADLRTAIKKMTALATAGVQAAAKYAE